MARIEVNLAQPEFGFDATDQSGKMMHMDTNPEGGGHDYGVRPMQALLMAMGGCSGIDIVSILKKMRQPYTSLRMVIDGEREQGKEPALWVKVHIAFHISGVVDKEKVLHAASLSIDKYCSVAETLRRAGCAITWEVVHEEMALTA